MAEPVAFTVAEADDGARLDRLLAARAGSRAQAQKLIEAGQVLVDGRVRAKNHILTAGQRVILETPEESPLSTGEAAPAPHRIAYEDQWLLVVDKPAGVVVHPSRGHLHGTLAQALADRTAGGEEWRPGIVHRLDRDTSGLLVVAKETGVHRDLKALLAARQMRREYLALVSGRPASKAGTIEAPIGRDQRDRTRMAVDGAQPREARTHFAVERLLPAATLLRVTLDTGRTHQIRVHLAGIGLPICGDVTYGVARSLGLRRQFLHAARLAFPHPVTGASLEVCSALPEDLAAALALAASGGAVH